MISKPLKILHIISTTDVGGAERNLQRLVCGMDRNRFENMVVSMTTKGPVGIEIEKCGIPVKALNMTKGLPDPRGIFRLMRIVRQFNPDIIQCWMYHANLLGLLCGTKVIWNIRCSNMDLSKYGPVYRWSVKLGARLSPFAKGIVFNSESGRMWHSQMGYSTKRATVIPNGFDTDRFQPGNGSGGKTVVMIARNDPMKDHQTFFKAAGLMQLSDPTVRFILAGRGITAEKFPDAPSNCQLLGERSDIAEILKSADIATLSSVSEGLPNTIGEAMACGLPCVATDAGDSRALISDTGIIVPTSDPQALCNAWSELLNSDRRQELGRMARKRILENYSLEAMISRYQELYEKGSS